MINHRRYGAVPSIEQKECDFLQREIESRFPGRQVAFRITFFDLTKDHIAALILSQIFYWFTNHQRTGERKVNIYRENKEGGGEFWLAKSMDDWWEECRVTKKQAMRALKILENGGWIQRERHRFRGRGFVVNHFRLTSRLFRMLYRLKNPVRGEYFQYDDDLPETIAHHVNRLLESGTFDIPMQLFARDGHISSLTSARNK